jgi:hypothetical protein
MREEVKVAFGKFVEQKWKDALNAAAAEPAEWDPVPLKQRR